MLRYSFIICLFCCLGQLSAIPFSEDMPLIDNEKAQIYIEKYKHIAIYEMDRSGVPASIKMAQGLLESGAGESSLATKANNHFGIKCGGDVWTGDTYYLWDDDVVKSCFRVYTNPEESFVAHTDFLLNPKKEFRYGFLFKLKKTDYKAWAKGLQSAGYATAKTYSKNLIALIERYELYKLDLLTSETIVVSDEELEKVFPSVAPKPVIEKEDTTAEVVVVPDPFRHTTDSVTIQLTKTVFAINGLKAVYVQPKDDLKAIATRYKSKVGKLKRFNELKKREIRTGQYIFLDKKKNNYTGNVKIHIVRQHEELYDIAQQYGIRLKKLQKLNKVYKQRQPATGTKIFLK
ncbi:MAG: LysM peptidoglycan-binding domain-containing protein [Aureispira sp.]|nr:LysM peptidoglycan-binding domain-containing protein [Aureispira sp.]